MSESVPRIGQAFTYPIILTTGAGAVLADPTTSGYEAGDCEILVGTGTTPTSITCTRRGTTEVLDIPISAAQHTASPVVIFIYDRNASAYLPQKVTLFTITDTKLKYDGSYIRETTTADVVQRHWSAGLVGGSLVIGAAVEGDVP